MLVRTRPYRPAVALRPFDRSFDRAFEQLTRSAFTASPRTPVVDAAWRDGDLVLTVDLPGVAAEHVAVTVAGRTLTLGVATDELSWERTVTIGRALDPEAVTARHVDGRLTVVIGAAASPEARTIEISTAAPAAIEPAATTAETAPEPTPEAGDDDQPANGTSDSA